MELWKCRGFTLLEVLVTLGIFAILILSLSPLLRSQMGQVRKTRAVEMQRVEAEHALSYVLEEIDATEVYFSDGETVLLSQVDKKQKKRHRVLYRLEGRILYRYADKTDVVPIRHISTPDGKTALLRDVEDFHMTMEDNMLRVDIQTGTLHLSKGRAIRGKVQVIP